MCSGEHMVEMDLETNFLQSSGQCGANMRTKLLLSRFSPSWILPGHILAAATCRLRGWAECFRNRTWVRTAHSHGNTLSCIRAERKTYIQEEWFTFQGKWDGVNCLTEALASRLESWKTCDDSHYSHPNTWAKASLCRQLFPLSGPWPTNHRCCLRPALASENFITLYSHTLFFCFVLF